ncbi:MAG TPA: hypothetical protein VF146_14915 [Bryobacteraceae bacterium]
MISIRKTVTELDRLEELNRAAVACFSQAIHSVEKHAVEMDPSQLAQFCSDLHRLSEMAGNAGAPQELSAVQSSFDGQVHAYSDKMREKILRLRSDFAAAMAALDAFSNSVTSNTSDLDHDLQRQLERLKKSAHASQDLTEIRTEVDATVEKVAASVQRMHAANQMSMAQMKDEIRLLHEEVKAARAARQTQDCPQPPRATQALAAQNKRSSVLLAVVRNLDGLRTLYPPNVIESSLYSFQERFKSLLPGSVVIERRAKEQFAAVLDLEPSAVIAMSGEMAQKLSPPFVEEDRGSRYTLRLDSGVGVLEFHPGTSPSKFESKLDQLARALSGQ